MGDVKIQPLGTRVLIRPLEEHESLTRGGLYIPETAKEKPQTGKVVAIGDVEEEIKVRTGQVVLYPRYTGTEIEMAGDSYLILDAQDILAIVND